MTKRRRSQSKKRPTKKQQKGDSTKNVYPSASKKKAIPHDRRDDVDDVVETILAAGIDIKSAYMMRKGKPPKFTENREARERILSALAVGANVGVAAAYGGVSTKSLNNWILRGKHEAMRISDIEKEGLPISWETVDPTEAPYLDFFIAVQRIRGVTAMTWVQVLASAAAEEPKWASYMLESQWEFGAKQVIEANITGKVEVGLTVDDMVAAREEIKKWESERFGESDAESDD